jgi:hypothetical protein
MGELIEPRKALLSKVNRRTWLTIFVALGLLVLAIVYVSFFNSAKYHYSKLDSLTMTAANKTASGNGMTFLKPVQVTTQFNKNNQLAASHVVNKNIEVYIAAASSYLTRPLLSPDLKLLSQNLSSPSNKYYSSSAASIQAFVTARVPKKVNVSFAGAKPFTNDAVKANAWVIDFKGTSSTKTVANLTGQALLLVGNKGYYYFMVYAPDSNWKANKSVWQQMLSSIKIDQ